jgi:hypothetical protein
MSDQVFVAIIGAVGGVVAASIPKLLDWYQTSQSNFPTLGETLEIRKLRLLRALVGEDEGRDLNIYLQSDFYRPALESLKTDGFVKSIGKTYHLTEKGNEYTRGYLKRLSSSWKPGKNLLK